jgi:DNA-binding beta-propeller fold protein YncE
MKTSAALLFIAVLVSACAAMEGPRSAPAQKLYEAVGGNTLAIVDSASRSTDRRLALGAAPADWDHLYSVSGGALLDTDPRSGDIQRSMQIGGSYRLPAATANGVPGGLSPDGHLLVVQSHDQRSTHMLVIDTGHLAITRRVDLAGDFEFDAIDDSGANLYLIQRLNGREYYVRLYDVSSGALTDNIVVDKSDGNQAMTGLRLSGLPSSGGHWLFSMYVRPDESPFVHALSLDGPFAFCLDLPGAGYANDPREMNWSLAMSGDGNVLYAVNVATGTVAEISTGADGAPAILRTGRFDAPGISGDTGASAAMVIGRELVAGGPAGLVWIDTSSLRVTRRALDGWNVAGVGLSPDGKTLYAVGDSGRVAAISVATGDVTGTFDPGTGRPLALMRVAAA